MNERTREEILGEGEERIARTLLEAGRLYGEYLAAIVEADEIRAEVQQATGVSLISPAPIQRPDRVEEYGLADVVEVRRRFVAFEEAAVLLVPLLEKAPQRTVGAVLKTCDGAVAARVREALAASRLFGDSSSGRA